METFTVNTEACRSCGLCAKACPLNVIGFGDTGFPLMRSDGATCMDCGHCASVCPVGAISRKNITAIIEKDRYETPAKDLSAFLDFMKNRRSCRHFQTMPVPFELVEKALDAARFAPSAKNCQPVEWTVMSDAGLIKNLAGALHTKARSNPALASRYAYVREDEDPVFRDAPLLVLVHGDPAEELIPGDGIIAATCFDFAAQALGLGTCWSGTAFSAAADVKLAAKIPAHHTLHAVIMLGFPAQRWYRLPERKPLRITRI